MAHKPCRERSEHPASGACAVPPSRQHLSKRTQPRTSFRRPWQNLIWGRRSRDQNGRQLEGPYRPTEYAITP